MSFFRSNQPTPPPKHLILAYHQVAVKHPMNQADMCSAILRQDTTIPPMRNEHIHDKDNILERIFGVASCPSDQLALTNCIIVHPSDFKQDQHVLVKQSFPLTPRRYREASPPTIGASAMQRQWIGLSLTGDEVTVEPLPSSPPYLQSIDIQVGFLRRGHEVAETFSADDMARNFLKAFNESARTVKSLSVVHLADAQRRGAPAHGSHYGVVMEKTDVTIMKASESAIKIKSSAKKAPPNAILAANFKFEDMGIGGLDSEFSSIFRRAFASRVFPPGLVEKLGIQHVKGILLFGPPGTGKTLMARQIGKMLNAREPKIVNGPEILNKFVGASEENIRKLFEDAEKEYKAKKDESGLHIIIFDELDAICKQRGSTGGGTGVGTVSSTNFCQDGRCGPTEQYSDHWYDEPMDMIDEALLRPGRLEMRTNGIMEDDVDLAELAQLTKNFSGAEINGLVKSATSFSFSRHVKVGTLAGISDDIENLRVNRNDFMNALEEVQPAFGVAKGELEQVVENGIIHFSKTVDEVLHSGELFVEQVRSSTRTPLVSVLLHGPSGSGKTAMAATIAQASQYPFMKLLSPDSMVGFSESQKVAAINKVFTDSYKSPLSVIVVDSLERLLEFTPIGPRFSNQVLQTLMVLLGRRPPKGRRLLIIATSSLRPVLTDLGLSETFDAELRVPPISSLRAVDTVMQSVELFRSSSDRRAAIDMLSQAGFGSPDGEDNEAGNLNIGIKKLLSAMEMARQEPEEVAERLTGVLMGLGL
ncbi:vesicular-fusion protein SEC18 [Amylocystis lapponica]|nr:vesicular-fusion protein SEC18 [Amylocystis lapponica]